MVRSTPGSNASLGAHYLKRSVTPGVYSPVCTLEATGNAVVGRDSHAFDLRLSYVQSWVLSSSNAASSFAGWSGKRLAHQRLPIKQKPGTKPALCLLSVIDKQIIARFVPHKVRLTYLSERLRSVAIQIELVLIGVLRASDNARMDRILPKNSIEGYRFQHVVAWDERRFTCRIAVTRSSV